MLSTLTKDRGASEGHFQMPNRTQNNRWKLSPWLHSRAMGQPKWATISSSQQGPRSLARVTFSEVRACKVGHSAVILKGFPYLDVWGQVITMSFKPRTL